MTDLLMDAYLAGGGLHCMPQALGSHAGAPGHSYAYMFGYVSTCDFGLSPIGGGGVYYMPQALASLERPGIPTLQILDIPHHIVKSRHAGCAVYGAFIGSNSLDIEASPWLPPPP